MKTLFLYLNSEFLFGLFIAVLILGFCIACYMHGRAQKLPIIQRRKTPYSNV